LVCTQAVILVVIITKLLKVIPMVGANE
jgi:hypothetical protein